tara:strand:+ start:245 stop:1363 length:1119 start_codon:yes stop_codon:yes gene_type:complete
MKKIKVFTLLIVIYLFIYGCSAGSLEYTTGITCIKTENDLACGEENLLLSPEITSDSTNALAPYQLAKLIYYKQERWVEMNKFFILAEQRNPGALLAEPLVLEDKVIKNVGDAIKLYRQNALSKIVNSYLDEKEAFEKIKNTIDKSLANEKFEKIKSIGIKKLNLAIQISPTVPGPYMLLSDIYKSELDNVMAIKILNNGILNNPTDWLLHYTLAELHQSNGDMLMALTSCQSAIDAGAPPNVYYLLFNIYFDLKKIEKAKEVSNILLENFQDQPEILSVAYYNRGILFNNIGTEFYQSAKDEMFKETWEENIDSIISDFIAAVENFNIAKTNFEDYKYSTENPDPSIDKLIKDTRKNIRTIEREYISKLKK